MLLCGCVHCRKCVMCAVMAHACTKYTQACMLKPCFGHYCMQKLSWFTYDMAWHGMVCVMALFNVWSRLCLSISLSTQKHWQHSWTLFYSLTWWKMQPDVCVYWWGILYLVMGCVPCKPIHTCKCFKTSSELIAIQTVPPPPCPPVWLPCGHATTQSDSKAVVLPGLACQCKIGLEWWTTKHP